MGISALFEHTLLPSDPNLFPSTSLGMDLYIPGVYELDSLDIALDVTVAHEHSINRISQNASFAGTAANFCRASKGSTLQSALQHVNEMFLLPIGISSYGALGDSGTNFSALSPLSLQIAEILLQLRSYRI